jgi:nucleoid-associated protein YgaU
LSGSGGLLHRVLAPLRGRGGSPLEVFRSLAALAVAILGASLLIDSRPEPSIPSRGSGSLAWAVPFEAIWVPTDPQALPYLTAPAEVPSEPGIPEIEPGPPPLTISPGGDSPRATRPATVTYVVQENDSFWKLAVRCYGDGTRHEELLDFNPGLRGRTLQPGMKIQLPRDGGAAPPAPPPSAPMAPHIVREGETLSEIAVSLGVPLDALFRENRDRLRSPDVLRPGMELRIPVAPRERGR